MASARSSMRSRNTAATSSRKRTADPSIPTTSFYGSPLKVGRSLSFWQWLLLFGYGVRAVISLCAMFLLLLVCSPVSRSRSTTRPSYLSLCGRGILLVVMCWFGFRLSAAEVHYAHGFQGLKAAWPGGEYDLGSRPLPMADSMRELETAAKLYPFSPSFRDGPQIRMLLYARENR
jgi:hypothetical protein